MSQMNPQAHNAQGREQPVVVRHEFLTKDRTVQRTTLGDGWRVTVNFGARPFAMGNGASLLPMSFLRERAP
jgi:hypothetical protein